VIRANRASVGGCRIAFPIGFSGKGKEFIFFSRIFLVGFYMVAKQPRLADAFRE